jgi:DNA (cytosine-5)-methyltransferase 1
MAKQAMIRSCIDLFAGCGGLSLGLHKAGFNALFAVEANADAFSSYEANLIDTGKVGKNWPTWLPKGPTDVTKLVRDHEDELRELRGQVGLIAGGPPCQGFSMNGRRNPDDPRSLMVEAYLDIVDLVRPDLILFENVRGFVSMPHKNGGTYEDAVRARLDHLGYDTWADVLVAADWGVPQRRPRYICIGARKGSLPGIDPMQRLRTARKSFLAERGLRGPYTTVSDALSDLHADLSQPAPDPEWGTSGFSAVTRADDQELTPYQLLMRQDSGDSQPSDRRLARHNANTVARMQEVLDTCTRGVCISPKERARLGIGKRSTTPLDGSRPSPTITTLPDDLIHYNEPRTMSVRELARLQSFPDWFSFKGPYTTGGARRVGACPRYTQVGNAVPPLLAEALGETLAGLYCDQELSQAPDIVELGEKVSPVALEIIDGQRGCVRSSDLPSVAGSLFEGVGECVSPS